MEECYYGVVFLHVSQAQSANIKGVNDGEGGVTLCIGMSRAKQGSGLFLLLSCCHPHLPSFHLSVFLQTLLSWKDICLGVEVRDGLLMSHSYRLVG